MRFGDSTSSQASKRIFLFDRLLTFKILISLSNFRMCETKWAFTQSCFHCVPFSTCHAHYHVEGFRPPLPFINGTSNDLCHLKHSGVVQTRWGTHREWGCERKAAKLLGDEFQLSVVPLTLSLLTLKLSDQIFPEKLQDFTFLAKGKFPYWA